MSSTDSSPKNSFLTTLKTIPGYRPMRTALWFVQVFTAWPFLYLLWTFPRTLYRIWRDMIRAHESAGNPIMAYAYNTASYMAWYMRVSRDILQYGPIGYAYGDALGIALGDRFFFHTLTYGYLMGKLGPRRYALVSGTILVASVALIGFLTGQWAIGLMMALIVTISPALLLSLFHLSKPEIFGWAFLPLTIYFMARGEAIPASIGLLFLSMTSITMALPAALIAGALWMGGALSFVGLLIIGVPISLKFGWQFLRFLRRVGLRQFSEVIGGSGSGKTLTDQTYLQYRRLIVLAQKIWCVLQVLLTAALLLGGAPWGAALVMLLPVMLLILNYRLFRWADQPTFVRLFLAIDVAYALLFPSWLYILALALVLLAAHPRLVLEAGGLEMENLPGGGKLADYPYTKPIYLGDESVARVRQFFASVPDGCRVAWEAIDPFGKSVGGYRSFHLMLEWILYDRHIELLPGEWLRATQTDWYLARYARLNVSTQPQECAAISSEIGAQYLLVSTEAFRQSLMDGGYEQVDHLLPEVLRRTSLGELLTPDKNLYLMKTPEVASLIEPVTAFTRFPNRMTFEGRANTQYFIKYNFHPAWSAQAQGQPLPLKRVTHGTLSGIEVTPSADGLVTLDFKASWLL